MRRPLAFFWRMANFLLILYVACFAREYIEVMKRFVLAVFFLLAVFRLPLSAKVPDENDILSRILDTSSPQYYPSLMMRYMGGDTTLTDDDYHYLYYGYAYDPNYRPLEVTPSSDRILEILAAVQQDAPTSEQAQSIVDAASEIMAVDPFSPKNINFMTYAYEALGDTVQARVNADRFAKIIRTIESSGSGLKESEPKHVLRTEHANDVLAARGLYIQSREVRTRSVEYIRLREKDGNVKGYYFDFGRMYRKAPELTPEKKPSRWQINGFPL